AREWRVGQDDHAIPVFARNSQCRPSINLHALARSLLPPARALDQIRPLRDTAIAAAIYGKIFRPETKRLSPKADRERQARRALEHGARSSRSRAAGGGWCRCARVVLPEKCKRAVRRESVQR